MVDSAIKNNKWVIFEIHEVNSSGHLYSTTKAIFDQTVDYVALKKIPVITIDQGINSY